MVGSRRRVVLQSPSMCRARDLHVDSLVSSLLPPPVRRCVWRERERSVTVCAPKGLHLQTPWHECPSASCVALGWARTDVFGVPSVGDGDLEGAKGRRGGNDEMNDNVNGSAQGNP